MYQKRYTQNRTDKTDGFTNKKRHICLKKHSGTYIVRFWGGTERFV